MPNIRRGYCRTCGTSTKQVETQSLRSQTLGHLLLTIFTAGLWLIPWFLILLFCRRRWACDECGSRV